MITAGIKKTYNKKWQLFTFKATLTIDSKIRYYSKTDYLSIEDAVNAAEDWRTEALTSGYISRA